MKIRTRLFLIFGILFACVFLATFYVEEYFTRTSLVESEGFLKKEIMKIMGERRKQFIAYVGDLLQTTENRIEEVTTRVEAEKLISDAHPLLDLSTLMLTERWIDLAQYGNNTIVFGEKRLHPATIEKNAVWIDEKMYIGIPIDSDYTVLFEKEYVNQFQPSTIKDVQVKILEPFIQWIAIPDRKTAIEKVIEELQTVSIPTQTTPPPIEQGAEVDRYHLLGMAWGLANMLASEAVKPAGMVYKNQAVLTQDIFYGDIVPQGEGKIITLPDIDDVFFGDTQDGLTIGVRGKPLLSEITRAMGGYSAFITDNRVILSFTPQGEVTTLPSLPVNDLLGKETGMVTIGNEQYFFIHMDPQGFADFHFFVFIPKAQEFALIDQLDKDADALIHSISMHVRYAFLGGLVLVLFILNGLSRRITRPITRLADLTKEVAGGRLEEIEIPPLAEGRKDEVYTLYHNFFDMVKGLKEKERVRGILNKVVSPEIAEETLKGNIQLGGEEKEVTVFFADIRNFTSMTENMAPHDVITLINSCMTKVSHIIDEYGGVIDKYVGDEVMALFGAPVAKPDSPLKAVECAKAVIEELRQWKKLEMGIGIHTGVVVAGNMGAENRLNYTVLGSGVNLAARLCQIAKPMEILISESTMAVQHVHEVIQAEEKSSIELKGFTKPIKCFSVSSRTIWQ